MKKDLVSIIIPIHNADKTLRECLDSIMHQSYDNYEVIMVNDGSIDDSAAICKEYSKKDRRFRYFKKENGGVSSARNLALGKSEGKYVSFVDSDDYIDTFFLSCAISLLESTDSDIFICNFSFVDEFRNNQRREGCIKKKNDGFSLLNKDSFLVGLVDGNGIGSGCCNKVYKRKLLRNLRFKNVAVAEDLYYNFEISKRNEKMKVVYSSRKLYYYRLHKSSVMHGSFSDKNLDVIKQYGNLIALTSNGMDSFNKALKASYAFISCKIIIKMVSSSVYNEGIADCCKKNIKRYRWLA